MLQVVRFLLARAAFPSYTWLSAHGKNLCHHPPTSQTTPEGSLGFAQASVQPPVLPTSHRGLYRRQLLPGCSLLSLARYCSVLSCCHATLVPSSPPRLPLKAVPLPAPRGAPPRAHTSLPCPALAAARPSKAYFTLLILAHQVVPPPLLSIFLSLFFSRASL